MAETLCRSPETTTTLLTDYTPMQDKKFKVWGKKKKQKSCLSFSSGSLSYRFQTDEHNISS